MAWVDWLDWFFGLIPGEWQIQAAMTAVVWLALLLVERRAR
jgi:hypothetical protein